ncbi:MAG: hypothetical protein RI911_360 [Candidatus Parcubacteria bacterium]|jgi:pimeloyl-ACP methyl ester carboxylesterase
MLDQEEKLFITNRKGERLCCVVRHHKEHRGVAVVLHGLAATKDQKMIVAAATAFADSDFTVLRFDATNSFGESDGSIEHATLTKHTEDLEDVLAWVQQQPWYSGDLLLAGHSMGGYSVARYAELHPEQVAVLFPISPVVSGELTLQSHEAYEPGYIARWKDTGWRSDMSVSSPGQIRRIPWSHMEDRLKHSLLTDVSALRMPTTIIVGSDDRVTTPEHMQLLLDAVPAQHKKLVIVPECAHVFRGDEQCSILAKTIRDTLTEVYR